MAKIENALIIRCILINSTEFVSNPKTFLYERDGLEMDLILSFAAIDANNEPKTNERDRHSARGTKFSVYSKIGAHRKVTFGSQNSYHCISIQIFEFSLPYMNLEIVHDNRPAGTATYAPCASG